MSQMEAGGLSPSGLPAAMTNDSIPDAGIAVAVLLRSLVPRFYWYADAQSGALGALIDTLAVEYQTLRNEVDTLYDDLFVETCDQAILPYLGWNIGVSGLSPFAGPGLSDRAWVGRSQRFAKRKGTLSALAAACSAATGWSVLAVDTRTQLGRTQSLQHLAFDQGRLASVSGSSPPMLGARLPALTGPPGQVTVVDGDPGAGPGTVAVGVWRLMAFAVRGRSARPVVSSGNGRAFTIHPAGVDSPLFRVPQPLADSRLVPGPDQIGAPLSFDDMRRILNGPPLDPPTLAITVAGERGELTPVPPQHISVADLGDWQVPPGLVAETEVVVDPTRGRLLFLADAPANVTVDSAYGFAGEIGGGPYGVTSTWSQTPVPTLTDSVNLTTPPTPSRPSDGSLAAKLTASWDLSEPPGRQIIIEDSGTYAAPDGGWQVTVGSGQWLRLASAPEPFPVLDGDLHLYLSNGASVELSGLMILGSIIIAGSGTLFLEHCTLAPGPAPSLEIGAAPVVNLTMTFCVTGAIRAAANLQLAIDNSIVDGPIGTPDQPIGGLTAEAVTAFGPVHATTVSAVNSVFSGGLTVQRSEQGLLRYSYLGPGSRPPVAAIGGVEAAGPDRPRLRFVSTRFGDAAYGRLDPSTSLLIRRQAELGGEMGAYNWLGEPDRIDRLPLVVADMLPAATRARVTFHT